MTIRASVGSRYLEAMPCERCFGPGSLLQRPLVSLPQPRWVGQAYGTRSPRVVVVTLNPGVGGGRHAAGDTEFLAHLQRFAGGTSSIEEFFAFQAQHMYAWSQRPGRFPSFYAQLTGLPLDELAFLNAALCATQGNMYPPSMLNTCYMAHTRELLALLNPSVVLLSGSSIWDYAPRVQSLLPDSVVEAVLHFAHREGVARDEQEFQRVRALIKRAASAA